MHKYTCIKISYMLFYNTDTIIAQEVTGTEKYNDFLNSSPIKSECTVDFRNNKFFEKNEVSFHWWSAEETSLHRHNFYEFFIITDGAAVHRLNGKTSKLSKGTLYLIRPEDCHQFRKTGDGGCIHLNFCVTPERFKALCGALKIPFDELIGRDSLSAKLSGEELKYFVSRARELNVLSRFGGDSQASAICAIIADAAAVVYRSGVIAQMNYPEWFTELLEKIHSPENIACTASDIYKMGGFSAPVMIEYFKKYTGKSVAAYLRDIKCDYACILLKNTSLSTLEISGRLGYDSLSHFNRIFKEYIGVTPAVYRNGSLENPKK